MVTEAIGKLRKLTKKPIEHMQIRNLLTPLPRILQLMEEDRSSAIQ